MRNALDYIKTNATITLRLARKYVYVVELEYMTVVNS